MKTQHLSASVARAALLILMMGGATSVMAQSSKANKEAKAAAKAQKKESTDAMVKRQSRGAMQGPHQTLAMAYRDNLANFARALRQQVNASKTVNLDLARPAVAEMRRSFEEMRTHHRSQLASMSDQAMPSAATKEQLEARLSSLGEHLSALNAEVNMGSPNATTVSTHLTEIINQCAGMSGWYKSGDARKAK